MQSYLISSDVVNIFHSYRFIRMSPERFEHLLLLVGPSISKKPCRSRSPIPASERLALTLRYLATGDSQQSESVYFRIGRATVSNIIRETCNKLWQCLQPGYLSASSAEDQWKAISYEFRLEWNFPHGLGALDGKHIAMECPHDGGSAFYNYKNFHSIVLMAICDARYCFTLVDIGGYGRENDAGLLSQSPFGQALEKGRETLNIPSPEHVGPFNLPYVFVGGKIFPLKPWLMKPYPGKNLDEPRRIYNYRQSRARRTIENSFGILAARWRVFRRPIRAAIETVEGIVKAAVCLHNYLRLIDNTHNIPAGFVDKEDDSGDIIPGDWRNIVRNDDGGLTSFNQIGSNRYGFEANRAREDFLKYFNSAEGSVSWQLQHVRNCGRINVPDSSL